jgi:hypothetical protein
MISTRIFCARQANKGQTRRLDTSDVQESRQQRLFDGEGWKCRAQDKDGRQEEARVDNDDSTQKIIALD